MTRGRRGKALGQAVVQVAEEPQRSIARRVARRVVPPLIVVACSIGVWYLVSYYGLSKDQRFLLPPPHQVFKEGFLDWQNFHEILVAMEATTKVAIFAFIFSTAIGIFFAVLMSEADWIERSFFPFAVALQTLPFLAIVPLVGFWFGFTEESRIIVATIVSLFPIITNSLFGLKSTEPSHRDLFRLHRAGRLEQLWRLKLPGALPSIFSGLRISAGLCVIASIVTDFFIQSGNPGIGLLLEQYASQLLSERLLAALVMTAVLGIAVYLVISAVAYRVVGKWHSSYIRPSGDD
jgi:NitT/TauT family transport system permease protein